MLSGYDTTYALAAPKLKGCNFDEAAERLGFNPPLEGCLRVSFLGRDYGITADGVNAVDGSEADAKIKSLLVYYITSPGCGLPLGEYRLPDYFVGKMVSGGGSLSWMMAPLEKRYAKDPNGFDVLLNEVGALPDRKTKNGERVWVYGILPKIPIKIVYVPADDEFPCAIRLLLDKGAGRFLEFEQIAFLCGSFVERLVDLQA